jgi:hypothetical protein
VPPALGTRGADEGPALSARTPSLAALLAARNDEQRLRRAITDRFEFTGNRRDKVRTTEVYDVVATAMDLPVSTEVSRMAMRLVVELGGQYTNPGNLRHFACVRRRDVELVPGQGRTAAQLMGAWWRRLQGEEMGFEPAQKKKFSSHRAEINLAMFERLRRDYWARRRALDIWGLYACDGLSEDEIAERTGVHKSSVHRVIAREKARMNRSARDQERSDAEEVCEVDPDGDS